MLATTTAGVRNLVQRQRLLDVYGGLLTDHQREACRLHLDEDWSVTELAEHYQCSRSGAHDLVRRALSQLEHYESCLGHAAELSRRDVLEAELRQRLARALHPTTSGRRTPAPQRLVASARRAAGNGGSA